MWHQVKKINYFSLPRRRSINRHQLELRVHLLKHYMYLVHYILDIAQGNDRCLYSTTWTITVTRCYPKIPAKHMKLQWNAIRFMIYAEFVFVLIIHCIFKEFLVSFTFLLRDPIHNIIWDNKCLHRLTYCIQARASTFLSALHMIKKKIAKPYWEFKKNIYMQYVYDF